jgi:hypothetical protein
MNIELKIEFTKILYFGMGIAVSEESLGIKFLQTQTKPAYRNIYAVIDKHLFMLAVLKHGLEFKEVK